MDGGPQTVGRTDGRSDGRTNGRTEGRGHSQQTNKQAGYERADASCVVGFVGSGVKVCGVIGVIGVIGVCGVCGAIEPPCVLVRRFVVHLAHLAHVAQWILE